MDCDNKTDPNFESKVWVSDGMAFDYAEKSDGVKQNTGVCFSGGGTRALAATMGQLRGLDHLRLIEGIDYISCVSGGSWAAVPYTYYHTKSSGGAGPVDDASLLGPVTDPGDIVVSKPSDPGQNWLGYAGAERLGTTATQSLVLALFNAIFKWCEDYLKSEDLSLWDPENWKTALKHIP